jgi:hypothetical protein
MAARKWTTVTVEDMGRTFHDVYVEDELVARHTDIDYARLHADAMNAIEHDPEVQAAVEREAMRRVSLE